MPSSRHGTQADASTGKASAGAPADKATASGKAITKGPAKSPAATLPTKPSTPSAGFVSASEIYTAAELQKRLGLGRDALRAARRRGLPVKRLGKISLIAGKDLIEFVSAINSSHNRPAQRQADQTQK